MSQQQSDDIYFEKKAEEIRWNISNLMTTKRNCTADEIFNIIYLGIKEVARDQRYACVGAVQSYYNSHELHGTISNVQGIIQNAMIEDK